jgi:hypothetical protein
MVAEKFTGGSVGSGTVQFYLLDLGYEQWNSREALQAAQNARGRDSLALNDTPAAAPALE